jgi:hypothetical protein
VPADKKKVRDYLVARAVVETLQRMGPKYPTADGDVRKLKDAIE